MQSLKRNDEIDANKI